MPRAGVQELVYVLVVAGEQGLGEVEIYGTRSQAEFAAEAIARAEGHSTKDMKFDESGELLHGDVGIEIFVLPRQILRKPRVLKEKKGK